MCGIRLTFVAPGGLLAAATSARFALGAAAVLLLVSGLLFPWRHGWPAYDQGTGM